MMRTAAWITLSVFAAAYLIYAIATIDRRGDEVQIRSLIQDAAAAIQKHDLGGTISCVSVHYKDSTGLNYDRLRNLTATTLRIENDYTTSAEILRLDITGKDAVADVHAVVRSVGGRALYDRELTLILQKESSRHAGIIPVEVWRVISVSNLGLNFEL